MLLGGFLRRLLLGAIQARYPVSRPVSRSVSQSVESVGATGQDFTAAVTRDYSCAICSCGAFWILDWICAWRNFQLQGGWALRILAAGVSTRRTHSVRRPMASYSLCVFRYWVGFVRRPLLGAIQARFVLTGHFFLDIRLDCAWSNVQIQGGWDFRTLLGI